MSGTFIAKPADIKRKWFVVDAEGKTLGRLATVVAGILRGKDKVIFTPNVDTGDHVIVINAEKIVVTGKKPDQKMYFKHSGYSGGDKQISLKGLLAKKPEEVIKHAVKGMLPKGALGYHTFAKLKVYKGPAHKHEAQKPELLKID